MRGLLIITQKVDETDDVLGFFLDWIREFATHYDQVSVICLWEGRHNLPTNVKVYSLGKDQGASKIAYLIRFYKFLWKLRNSYRDVFVHMNPLYAVLGGLWWRLSGKKISLWYAHGHIPFMLYPATWFSCVVFTSTPEGFRYTTSKVKVVGQGINTKHFVPGSKQTHDGSLRIITIGRVSPSKDYDTLLTALGALKDLPLQVSIVGGPATASDRQYLQRLRERSSRDLGTTVSWLGPKSYQSTPALLQSADLFVNMGHTGSLDKAVLEAMATGIPVLTCNEAFFLLLADYKELLLYPKKDTQALAGKIRKVFKLSQAERIEIGIKLRSLIVEQHGLEGLISTITNIINA